MILLGRQPGIPQRVNVGRLHPKLEKTLPQLGKKYSSSLDDDLKEYDKRLFSLQNSWLDRMIGVGAPLEKMTLFWHGMLTSSYAKVQTSSFIVRQNQLFRSMAYGDYRELVKKIVVDPAMIVYLDIDQNRRTKPNENFARELLELFTLGEGNYSPDEIKKLAREIVGYSLRKPKEKVEFKDEDMLGMENNVGFSDKVKRLSKTVDSIFKKRACGHLLCRRLWKFFVSVDENPLAILSLTEILRDSKWQMKPVLREMFMSELFYADKIVGQQIKSPVQYLIQSHKEMHAQQLDKKCAYYTMEKLGQNLFNPPNVAGWPAGETWINGDSISARYKLSLMLSDVMQRNGDKVVKLFYSKMKQDRVAGLIKMMDHFLPVTIPAEKAKLLLDLAKGAESEADVHKMVQYMMCMPEYQMC